MASPFRLLRPRGGLVCTWLLRSSSSSSSSSSSKHENFVTALAAHLKPVVRPREPVTAGLAGIRPDFLDPRREALAAFDTFKEDVDNRFGSYVGDTNRAPIAVNSGTTGSGKTVQLYLVADHFEKQHKGVALYFTFNGSNSGQQSFDARMPISTRIVHRLVHAAVSPDETLPGFWNNARRAMGMPQPNAPAQNPEQEGLEGLLQTHAILVCRAVLGVPDAAPLLIAADELAKLGDEPPPGEESEAAVDALKALCDLSQSAFQWAQAGAPGTRAGTYLVASAYTAYNPFKGITVGSNRKVFWLPLPPLSLGIGWDRGIRACEGTNEQQLVARRRLWLQQGNARGLDGMYAELVADKPKATWTRAAYEKDLANIRASASGCVELFLEACASKSVDPCDLVRCVFWPQAVDKNTTQFDRKMKAALLAEAAGICSILRRDDFDSIYMHPTVCKVLCSEILASPHSAPFLHSVVSLCEDLEELPAQPGQSESGKLYKKVVTKAFVCRLTTCFSPQDGVAIGDLFPTNSDKFPVSSSEGATTSGKKDGPMSSSKKGPTSSGKGLFSECIVPSLLPEKAIACFPRAYQADVGRNVECPKMPVEPDFFAIFTDRYALSNDSLLSMRKHKVPAKGGTTAVAVGLQMKEHKSFSLGTLVDWQGKRELHLNGRFSARNVSAFLATRDFISVLVTPNGIVGANPKSSEIKVAGRTITVHEAFVTHEEIRKWCPMVAYSGCDARVLDTIAKPTGGATGGTTGGTTGGGTAGGTTGGSSGTSVS
jgi:hypothetical protein